MVDSASMQNCKQTQSGININKTMWLLHHQLHMEGLGMTLKKKSLEDTSNTFFILALILEKSALVLK